MNDFFQVPKRKQMTGHFQGLVHNGTQQHLLYIGQVNREKNGKGIWIYKRLTQHCKNDLINGFSVQKDSPVPKTKQMTRYFQGLVHKCTEQNSLYVGQVMNRKKHGKGIQMTRYINQHGDFQNDKTHGFSVQKQLKGSLTSGFAESGQYNGCIKRKWLAEGQGCEFLGIVKKNKMHIGKLNKNDQMFYGIFQDGQPYRGSIISEISMFEGEFKARSRQVGILTTNLDLY